MKVWDKVSHRVEKINNSMRESLVRQIHTNLHHPDLGTHVSILEVACTKDLRTAKVFYTTLRGEGTEEENAKVVGNALKEMKGELQGLVGRDLNLKFAPKLRFVFRASFDNKIDELFDQIHKRKPKSDE